eukprot:952870-Prymnesium_polylepis.2
MMHEAVRLLRDTEFFSIWSEVALQRLFFYFTPLKVEAGQDVMRQGDPADCCYVIHSGTCDVLVSVPLPEGEADGWLDLQDAATDGRERESIRNGASAPLNLASAAATRNNLAKAASPDCAESGGAIVDSASHQQTGSKDGDGVDGGSDSE